ncbi:cytochrome P450 2U1-like isoform X2 [Amphiura filiformis]|uniref:cytochrome P450 2U1-like isoform X2 n=1 Tax=Amphiura filiformis TaxID=82378 RepID=UPI003B22164F
MWYMYKGEELHMIVTRLGHKYGKIYSFDLFGLVVVVINDFSIMQEGLNDPALNNKGYNNVLQSEILGHHSHSYKHNAELRKFLLTAFRGLGIGKCNFEANTVEESNALVDELNAQEGKACNPHHYLGNATTNVLFKVLFGKRHDYDDDQFRHLLDLNHRLMELLGAGGGESVSATIEWFCLYMMAHLDIQQKIQEEIDSVVGQNRLPLLSDQNNLPYTRATLLEIHRHVSLSPLSDFHAAGNETSLFGYRIPKGATIISNLYAVMRDPIAFPDPDQFKPERFIDENGEYVEKKEVIPFGVGRRICPGENIAKMELFVFFTHLLHRFSLVKPEDIPPITFEGIYGATFAPKPFTTIFLPRN